MLFTRKNRHCKEQSEGLRSIRSRSQSLRSFVSSNISGSNKMCLRIALMSFQILVLGNSAVEMSKIVAQQVQTRVTGRSTLGSHYVPSDAILVGDISIAATLMAPQMEMYPIEIIDAWAQQYLGVGVGQLESLRIVVAAPGPSEPQFGMILTTTGGVDVARMGTDLVDTESEIQVDSHACYPIVDAPGVVFHQHKPSTLIIASEGYLDTLIRSSEPVSGRGPLAKLADAAPRSANATVVASIAPIRPLAMGMIQSMGPQIPPPLQPFTQIPALLDAVTLGVDLSDAEGTVEFSLLANDESAASQLNELIANGLAFGRQFALAQMASELDPNDPMADATRRYMERVSSLLVASISPKQSGERLTIKASPSQGLATQGVLVGMLLPAVQSARQAARRVSSMNNLKQIGLAMHNSHSVYRKFPGDIQSADGTPLLSWRVAILPFIEENSLYEQFRKDEPWDSPHNLQLAEKMPAVYQHPGMKVDSGSTVYQRPVGPQFLFEGHEGISLRQITDGTSNTIMVVESPADAAVPWTKPTDLRVDMVNLVGSICGWTRDGFNALLADGSVRYIASTVDGDVLKALLTRNGGEVVGQDF